MEFVIRPKWKDIELNSKIERMFSTIKELGKDNFFGSSPPSVFVGSKLKYPSVNVGILSPPVFTEDSWLLDSPRFWASNKYSIKDIVKFRNSLINSRFRTNVKSVRKEDRFLDITKEIGIAYKPVDMEVYLKKKPSISENKDKIITPSGFAAPLKKIKITENPKVWGCVDKAIDDIDLKAEQGVNYLYSKGIDENFLTKILSIGCLGLKKNRKLVSTRWSITAVDDILGKNLISKIKDYGTIDKYKLFYGNFFGNYYYILLFPEVWSYELFEGYLPGAIWNFSGRIEFATDYENYGGRTDYASHCVGGYYAARLPILEYLDKIKRQASVLVVRFETPEYTDSLGVWVPREAGRKAINNKPIEFEDRDRMVECVKQLIYNRFGYNIKDILKGSILLNKIRSQKKLFDFVAKI